MFSALFRKIADYSLSLVYRVGSRVVPKKENLLVFRSFHDPHHFSGNVKALLEYAHKNFPEYNCVLVSPHAKMRASAKKKGLKTNSSKLGMFWKLLRAELVLIDSYTKLFRKGKFDMVQLGHGTGFKNIGLLNKHINKSSETWAWNKGVFQAYQLILATSKTDLEKKNLSYGVEHAQITGLPRNDVFFGQENQMQKLKVKFRVQDFDKIITYAPTFRDFLTDIPFSKEFWDKLIPYLEAENAAFVVKKHPWDRHLHTPDNFDYIRDLSHEVDDVQELLLVTDLLITDYSSISSDFVITGKPLLIYGYDFDLYKKNCRSVFYDLEEILPKPFVKNEDDLLEKIQNSSWQKEEEIQNSYQKFRQTFHQYLDGNSAERVMEAITNLFQNMRK